MDRSAVLSVLGLLLIIVVVVETVSFSGFASRWDVDTTSSIVNTGKESIRSIVKPPETTVVEYEGKSVIVLDNLSSGEENALFSEPNFRNALASEDRLLLYAGEGGMSAVVASYYFNDAELRMLGTDQRVVGYLKDAHSPGITNISYIEVSDPTNARVEWSEVGGYWAPILAPYNMGDENFSLAETSGEFSKVMEESRKLNKKTLLLYHPSKSSMNVIIPVNFTNDEVRMLAKNFAVKNAMETMHANAGELLALDETREFQDVDMRYLPYRPNTRVYTSFNIRGELGFLSEDILVYLAIFVVVLVIFYVLYTILIA